MGRKKIEKFELVADANKRKTMCSKRTSGMLKKGMELAKFTGAKVALLVEMDDCVHGGKQVMAFSNGGNHLQMVKEISKSLEDDSVYFEELSLDDYTQGRNLQNAAPHISFVNNNSIVPYTPPAEQSKEHPRVIVTTKNTRNLAPPKKKNPYNALKSVRTGVTKRKPTGRTKTRKKVTAQIYKDQDVAVGNVVKITETSTQVREFNYYCDELNKLIPDKYKSSSQPSSPSSSETQIVLSQINETAWKPSTPPPYPWMDFSGTSLDIPSFQQDDILNFDQNPLWPNSTNLLSDIIEEEMVLVPFN
jgi:hypothetical protein